MVDWLVCMSSSSCPRVSCHLPPVTAGLVLIGLITSLLSSLPFTPRMSLSLTACSQSALFRPFQTLFLASASVSCIGMYWADILVLTYACLCYLLFNNSLHRTCSACSVSIWVQIPSQCFCNSVQEELEFRFRTYKILSVRWKHPAPIIQPSTTKQPPVINPKWYGS